MAEREGFEPSEHLLGVHTISSRAPSASSGISPQNMKIPFVFRRSEFVETHFSWLVTLKDMRVQFATTV